MTKIEFLQLLREKLIEENQSKCSSHFLCNIIDYDHELNHIAQSEFGQEINPGYRMVFKVLELQKTCLELGGIFGTAFHAPKIAMYYTDISENSALIRPRGDVQFRLDIIDRRIKQLQDADTNS